MRLSGNCKAWGDPEKAKGSAWFFKTGPGQYGEGDLFLGVTVPVLRKMGKRVAGSPISLEETEKLLQSEFHEARLVALYVLISRYLNGSSGVRESVFHCYLANTRFINNWDLVDTSAEHIVGRHVEGTDRARLRELAASDSLWERRIAMVACYYFIKKGESETAFEIAGLLKGDRHDLIQKAVGWMLKEIGKRCSRDELERWLLEDVGTRRCLGRRCGMRSSILSRRSGGRYLRGTRGEWSSA